MLQDNKNIRMDTERKIRKYRLAELLARYDEATQRAMVEQLRTQMGIGRQMFYKYVNATRDNEKLNLRLNQSHIIADFFGVALSEVSTRADSVV